jgi:hypothetical protein
VNYAIIIVLVICIACETDAYHGTDGQAKCYPFAYLGRIMYDGDRSVKNYLVMGKVMCATAEGGVEFK